MGINLYNSERYLDLTAYEALINIERENIKKRLVYICSPYAGDIDGNIEMAKRYARFAVSLGKIPIIPHLMYSRFLNEDDSKERKLGIAMGLVLVTICRELWYFGDDVSKGMAMEINKAEKSNLVIRQFSTDCKLIGGRK